MNIQEIYVLNRALDGENILGIEPFAALEMSGLLVETVKDSLIRQGVLESHTSLTAEGVRLVNQMLEYKQASKYLVINSIAIAILDSHRGILLERNPLDGDYVFHYVDIVNCVQQLLDSYPAFLEQQDSQQLKLRDISSEELKKAFDLNFDNSFGLITVDYGGSEAKKTKELFFCADGQLYQYDYLHEQLHTRSVEGLKAALQERVGA